MSAAQGLESESAEQFSAYDLFVAVVAVIALAILGVRLGLRDDSAVAELLDIFDLSFCAVFFVDFIRNTVRAPNRRRYLMTWGVFDLLSSLPTVAALRLLRVVRLIRVVRALRSIRILYKVARRNRAASLFAGALTVMMMLFVAVCIAVLSIEHAAPGATIQDASDVLWWAVVTSSTVGYGDYYPVTDTGRLLGTLLMFAGVGLFATASGSIGGMLVQSLRENEHPDDAVQSELRSLKASVARIERAIGVGEEDS